MRKIHKNCTGMGDRLQAVCNQPPGPTQSVGREMSTGQCTVTCCGWK